MTQLIDWLASIYAFLSVIPFVSFFLIWFLCYALIKDKKKSTKLAVDGTTFFLWGVAYILCRQVLSSTLLFWLVILFMLIFAGWIGWEQNSKRGAVDGWKVFRIVWRISFLPLIVLYILLIVTGIVQYTMKV